MVATAITVTSLAYGAATSIGSGTDADGSNGNSITLPAGADAFRVLLHVVVGGTSGDGGTLTILAGDNPPAFRKGLGSLALTLGDTDNKLILIEPARHIQDDGTIQLTCSSLVAKLRVYLMPKE